LTTTNPINQRDEIGALSTELVGMKGNLKEVIRTINSQTVNITSYSEQINQSSQDIASGAKNQAISVEEVSASMEEMLSNIQQNAENAFRTDEMSVKVNHDIKKTKDATNETNSSILVVTNKIGLTDNISGKPVY